jgi:hypothetical protein
MKKFAGTCEVQAQSRRFAVSNANAAKFAQEPGGNPRMEPLARELTNLLKEWG